MIDKLEGEIRQGLGSFIFGVDKESMEEGFLNSATRSGAKVAIIELGTDNLLQKRIESLPDGVSLLVALDKTLYRNKTVIPPELTEPSHFKLTAEQWAEEALQQPGVTLAIVTLSEERGTAIAVATSAEMRSRTYGYGGSLVDWPEGASGWALSLCWYMLTSPAVR